MISILYMEYYFRRKGGMNDILKIAKLDNRRVVSLKRFMPKSSKNYSSRRLLGFFFLVTKVRPFTKPFSETEKKTLINSSKKRTPTANILQRIFGCDLQIAYNTPQALSRNQN